MRLLSLDSSGKLALTEFPYDKVPPYAILSHTWRADGEEVTFKDLSNELATSRPGYVKIRFCGEQAANHGLKYFWVDTCCIDKSSSAELQESINSMCRWYQNSARCYVFLADVSTDDGEFYNHPFQSLWEASFRASRWFTRGWTLQELIAPGSVEFYSREGRRLGDKKSLEQQVHEITSIPITALRGSPLSSFGIEERLLWAQKRNTTRAEDWAYSLLGIFDVFMPLLYGEGRDKAVMRLKREIDEAKRCLKPSVAPLVVDVPRSFNTQEVQTHDSMRSWVRSFQSGSSAGFCNVKQLVRQKGPVRDPSEELVRHQRPRDQLVFARQQPVPPEVRHLIQRSVDLDQAHLIISGLGPSGSEITDKIFPRSARTTAIYDYLEQEGFGPICGLQVHTDRGSYVVERLVPTTTISAVEVTSLPSGYSIQNGYRINTDERLVDFYNSRFLSKAQVAITANADNIEVRDTRYNQKACEREIYVDFKRTIRVPDDNQMYELPTSLASFPLLLSRNFSSTLPESMRIKDGIFFPMLQREALVLAFSSCKPTKSQFAIRIFTGGINVLTGQFDTPNPTASTEKCQDYIIAPQQGLLSGYRAKNSVKQFVAMPMGDKDSVEYQLTGDEFMGGIQLEFIPRLRDTVVFKRSPPYQNTQMRDFTAKLDIFAAPSQLGLHPGQRVYMLDHQPDDLYNAFQEEWSQNKDVVEPYHYCRGKETRPTFVHELFDGPQFAGFDPSSSLVVTILKPIEMEMVSELFEDGGAALTIFCSPLARMNDVRNFLRDRLEAKYPDRTWLGRAYISLHINDSLYDHKDTSLIGSLNLTSPQKIKFRAYPDLGAARLGANQGSSSPHHKICPGWDMGIAMGEKSKQIIVGDDSPHIWNWKAARVVNIQIMNTVAFQAVTGMRPPVSPLPTTHNFLKGAPNMPEPLSREELSLNEMIHQLQAAKSVNELDWERGLVPGVVLDGQTVVICVCCEKNICDSVMDQCGHMFCRFCISYYMTEQATTRCAFCLTVVSRVIQISAPSEAPHESKSSDKKHFASKVTNHNDHQHDHDHLEPDAITQSWGSSVFHKSFAELLRGSFHTKMIQDAIITSKYKLPDSSAILPFLIDHLISEPTLLSELPLGKYIQKAMTECNRDALRLLVPLYEVSNHNALEIARTSGINILDTIEELAMSRKVSLNDAVLIFGMLKATLLVKLGIFEVDISPGHVRSVARTAKDGELELLLSFGADPLAVDTDGDTLLHYTSSSKVVELLCNAGASIAALDGDRNTPISKAAAYGREAVLRLLLRQPGASDVLDQPNKFGKAAVHYAKTRPKILAMLVEAGADRNAEIRPKDPGL